MVREPSRKGRGKGPRLTYMIKQLELAIRAGIDAQARDYGLTAPQYTALTVLQRHPGMSGAQLSRRSFVSPQAGSEMIAQLERKGLIAREQDAQNRRILCVRLTSEGTKAVQSCESWMSQLEKTMLSGVSVTEARELRDLLTRCVHNLVDGDTARIS